MHNNQGTFTPVFRDGDPIKNTPGVGIGGYTGHTAADRAFAFDYDSSGRMDYICLYRSEESLEALEGELREPKYGEYYLCQWVQSLTADTTLKP